MKTTRSLSFIVTIWMALALAATMAGYAVYEYQTTPGLTWSELVVQHLGHVLGMGIVIYLLCWGIFYFVLLRPINRIYLGLYRIGTGQLRALELDPNVREIRTIVEGVNVMLSRFKLGADHHALDRAQQRGAEIREMLRQLAPAHPDHVSAVLDKLADLEQSLPHILATPAGERG